jgi:hypothetical protein
MWCAVVAMVILFDVLNFIWSMVIESSATLLSSGFCNSLAVIGFSVSFFFEDFLICLEAI